VLTIQAVIIAQQNNLFARVGKNFKGIFFLGTPHRGADLARLLGGILTATLSPPVFVDELRANSETIQDINAAFLSRAQELELVSYYESKGMRSLGVPRCNLKVLMQ
jgi:hypothetical protein